MQFSGIIQKARGNGFVQEPEKRLKELRQAIENLGQRHILVGRILTRKKHYSGRIEKLRLYKNGYLEFIITDCDQNGKSFKSAKTYRRKVSLEELEDIQI